MSEIIDKTNLFQVKQYQNNKEKVLKDINNITKNLDDARKKLVDTIDVCKEININCDDMKEKLKRIDQLNKNTIMLCNNIIEKYKDEEDS